MTIKAYESKPEVKEKIRARRKQRREAINERVRIKRQDPASKAARAALHQQQKNDPNYRARRSASGKKQRARPGVQEKLNFYRRYRRSGLPLELFEIQDLTRQIKNKISEHRRSEKNAL